MTEIGFTGTQEPSPARYKSLEEWFMKAREQYGNQVTLHHGDCIGADYSAHELAKMLGWRIIIHPPIIDDGKRAHCTGASHYRSAKTYLDRNHCIVDETNFLVALPKNPKVEQLRSGTWATIRYARRCGKRVILL